MDDEEKTVLSGAEIGRMAKEGLPPVVYAAAVRTLERELLSRCQKAGYKSTFESLHARVEFTASGDEGARSVLVVFFGVSVLSHTHKMLTVDEALLVASMLEGTLRWDGAAWVRS